MIKLGFFQGLAGLAMLVLLAGCSGPAADTEHLTQQGDALRRQGNDSGAAGYYARAIAVDPNDIAAHQALADILEAHGDYNGAAQQYLGALVVKPDNADLLKGYGRVSLKKGDAQTAKDAYEQALQQDNGDVKALNGLGIALDTLGNHTGAQHAYREALDNDSDDLVTLNNLGRSYILSGAYADAIKVLEPHAKDRKAQPALRQNLAEAYAMLGMDADAERISRMDFTGPALGNRMAALRAERIKLVPTPKLYADLGSFSTHEMAQARLADLRSQFQEASAGLVLEESPRVQSIGGVPHFTAMATGFARAERLRDFCAHLKAAGFVCQPHGI